VRIRIRILLVLAAFLAPLAATQASRAEVVDRVVAVINDNIITLSELTAATVLKSEGLKGEQNNGRRLEAIRSATLEDLIAQKLIKQTADKAGIDVSDREVDNAVEEVRDQNNLSEDQLLVALAGSGLTYREYKEQLREQIRQVKFINMEFRSKISIQDEEVEDYYRQNIEEFYGPPTFKIRMILLSGADAELQSLRLKAVQEGIEAGEDFAALASQYSQDGSSASGGDLGYLGYGELDARLEEAIGLLTPGGVSPPVARPEGIYIMKLIERRPGEPRPLEEFSAPIRERLFDRVMDEMFSSWLKEIKASAHIEIRL
jgi:peptidyl-prolyl cis-trans isomerase SurA